MAELSRFEKFFVNRRGESSFMKLTGDLESSGVLRIDDKSRVLELGGGNGAFSSLIYNKFRPASFTLTDYDPDQISLAKETLEKKFGTLPSTFILQQADARHLVFENNSFDMVLAHLILHHLGGLEDIFEGLKEVSRVLVPGGAFIYAEFAHKKEIRAKLTEMGFVISFRKGFHRETVVAIKQNTTGQS
ncbi:MAG: class I SAM-dependent methyltransferase [Candidatus Thermoplasmatota archaeon]|nr:class I SAM-dependent methyltransferase [Candidatus Thermoplasmatota archaeon]